MGIWTLSGDFLAFEESFYNSSLTISTSTRRLVVVSDSDGNTIELHGKGFVYEKGTLVGGIIEAVNLASSDGSGVWSGIDLSVDLSLYQGEGYPINLADMGGFGIVVLSGNDSIIGSTSSDWVIGAGGNDVMLGNKGKDSIFVFGGGRDKISGGGGADEFVFTRNSGVDKVTDFTDLGTAQDDRITVSQELYDKMVLEQKGDDVLIKFGKAGALLLLNIDVGQIGADDFRIGTFWDLQG